LPAGSDGLWAYAGSGRGRAVCGRAQVAREGRQSAGCGRGRAVCGLTPLAVLWGVAAYGVRLGTARRRRRENRWPRPI